MRLHESNNVYPMVSIADARANHHHIHGSQGLRVLFTHRDYSDLRPGTLQNLSQPQADRLRVTINAGKQDQHLTQRQNVLSLQIEASFTHATEGFSAVMMIPPSNPRKFFNPVNTDSAVYDSHTSQRDGQH